MLTKSLHCLDFGIVSSSPQSHAAFLELQLFPVPGNLLRFGKGDEKPFLWLSAMKSEARRTLAKGEKWTCVGVPCFGHCAVRVAEQCCGG